MGEIDLENYRKNVERLILDWGDEAARIGRELGEIQKQIDDLEANQPPSADDKKKIQLLKAKCLKLHQEMDNASASVDINLNVINQNVPKKAEDDLLKKIPDALKKLIKDKGVKLGKVIITPKVDIDFKGKKIKSIGITIKW